MRNWRRWTTFWLRLDLRVTIASCIVLVVLGSVLLGIANLRKAQKQMVKLGGTVLAAAGALGFYCWVFNDSRRAALDLRRQREERLASARREAEHLDA